MNGLAIAFVLVNAIALLSLPRRWAPLPLLVGACYMTPGQGIEIGPFHFTVIRILAGLAMVRVIVRRERLPGGMNSLDWLMIVWAIVALISSSFHKDPMDALIYRLGMVYNALGIYYPVRFFCHSLDELMGLCRLTAILLVPVAIEMLSEHVTGYNMFSVFGGVSGIPAVRLGSIRAQGPFAHAILAGTVGAVCLPLMIGLWQQHRRPSIAGIAACITMIFVSSSSGPIMSGLAGIAALFMWHYRHKMRLVRWLTGLGYIGLDLIMKAPAYYLIGRIDLTGGSSGWHRARLIESAFEHFSEWWLAGTDYTRHWMPTGVSWSPNHTDITNYYLYMGVVGGLPLLLLFIAILAKGFSFVGQILQNPGGLAPKSRFTIWAFGASLFVHAVTCISVSYFDQSFVFIYFTLALISCTRSGILENSCSNSQLRNEERKVS